MLQGQPAPGLDESGIARRNGYGRTGRHQCAAAARRQGHVLGGHQVGTGITLAGIGRERKVVDQSEQGDFKHGGDPSPRTRLATVPHTVESAPCWHGWT